jgi:hypothetical protein
LTIVKNKFIIKRKGAKNEINSNFETEIRNRIIDEKKFESIIYNFFIRILSYLKSLLVELYILGEFIKKYSLNTINYFEEKKGTG